MLQSNESGCRTEIAAGKADLEQMLGAPVMQFCYPYGRYESRHVGMVRDQDFATATTTQRSRCHSGMDVLEIPRVPVLRSTSLPMFWLKLATAYEDRRRK